MKICTVFTGGTIGSTLDESGYIGPKRETAFRVLQLYQEQFDTDVEFLVKEPYRILSENLGAQNLCLLMETIQEILVSEKDLDGIIVTHGTDTLQYGAAVLGYVFGDTTIPIVVVSSNYVLEDERANGLVNFQYAVEFIRGKYGKGVFVSYCNTGEYPTIHRATRLQPLIPHSDRVASVLDSWYGRFENGHYIANSAYDVKEGRPSLIEKGRKVYLSDTSDGITVIQPYVGMHYPTIHGHTKAILLGSYHSGTICISEELKCFAERANQQGIPIFLSGLLAGEAAYETVKEYERLGIICLHTSAWIAQYCKLWLALSNGIELQQIMHTSVAEDWIT